jgi:hypothetical protein
MAEIERVLLLFSKGNGNYSRFGISNQFFSGYQQTLKFEWKMNVFNYFPLFLSWILASSSAV